MTDARAGLPPHLGVGVGLSVGAYAVALAAVTGLQSGADAATTADRAPIVASLAAVGAENDALVGRLDAAKRSYESAAGAFGSVSTSLADYQTALAALTAAVGEIDGVSRSMPASYTPPRVTSTVSTASVPKVTTTTTGGSAPPP